MKNWWQTMKNYEKPIENCEKLWKTNKKKYEKLMKNNEKTNEKLRTNMKN